MTKTTLSCSVLGAALALALSTLSAQAQASRTWVSGVGNDANPCSRTAPCKTYAGAISKTAAGGEINCLDPGGFGAVTITKSMSIVCDYTEGGVLASLTSGFTVNMPVAGNIVTLKGQDVECFINGLNGVRILGAGVVVHIHKSQFRNCRGSSSNGINIAPSSGTSEVHIDQVYITGNGNAATQAGILIRPTGGAAVNVTVKRAHIEDNQNGIFMDGGGAGGGSNLSVINSVLSGNGGNGIAVSSTGPVMNATVANTLINANGAGAATAGAQAILRLGGNTITQNGTGVSNGGGTLQSFKNNQIAGNGVDGTPLTAVNSGGNILN